VLGSVLGWGSRYCPADQSQTLQIATAVDAVATALSMAGCNASDLGYVSCSANGSVKGDEIEAGVLRDILGDRLGSVPIAAPAESFGNALAPSGIIQTIEVLETAREGILPPFCGAQNGDQGWPELGFSPEAKNCGFDRALVYSRGLDGSVSAVVLGINV